MAHFSRNSRKGFTLIEILLAIALVALLSSVFVLNVGALLKDGELESLEKEYWRAVETARTGAVFTQQAHFLKWDEKGHRFLVTSAGKTQVFEVSTDSLGDLEIEVFFEEFAPENSYILIGGEMVAKRTIATAGFFPDGTCSPYSVSLKIGEYETNFQMDPWTGVQLVNPKEANAGF